MEEIRMRADGFRNGGSETVSRYQVVRGTWVGVCLIGLLLVGVGSRLAVAARSTSYRVMKKVKAGGEGGWDYLTIDPQARRLYISRGDHVDVVDVDTGSKVGQIDNTQGVHGIALAPKLGRGFTSNGRDNSVTIFDLKTLKELGRVTVGTGPDAILYDPATQRVFTMNGRGGDATAVDAATGKVDGTIALDGRPEFAAADGKGEVFVNLEDKSELLALDSKQLSVLHRWPLAPGEGPSGLAMDTAHRRLFSVCGNQKMMILDADDGHVVATPTIGNGPDAAAFDAKRQLAFSSNGRDGTLTVIHEEAPDRFVEAATVPTQLGARTMAVDAKTGHVFLVTAEFAPPPPGGEQGRRRTMLPGSFTILEVGP
jgi:DNA-binding beta-propeller fold protein YncE